MSWPHATIWGNGLLGPDGPIVGVDVSVVVAGSGQLADLFADEAKFVSLRNPLPKNVAEDAVGLDINGNLRFAVDPGDYQLTWTDGTGSHVRTFYVPPNQLDQSASTGPTQGAPGPAPWSTPVPYNDAQTYQAATATSPADAVNYNGSTYVAIVPSVTGVTPGSDPSKWQLVAAGADVATAIQQALTASRQLGSPHNAILGLAGSTLDPAQASSSTTLPLVAGQVVWAAAVLQQPTVTAVNVLVTTAQVGSGSQVGIFDAAGTLLRSETGSTVDTWLGTVGSRDLTLTSPLTDADVNIGDVVYVAISQPASTVTTPAQIRQAPAPASAINAHQTAGVRAGTAAGATIPSTLPLGSATAAPLLYAGLVA